MAVPPLFFQVLMIDLEDNLKGIDRPRKHIGGGALAEYWLTRTATETHFPDHLYENVAGVQSDSFNRVNVRRLQSSRSKVFFASGKNFHEIFLFHALDPLRPAKHEEVGITSRNLVDVKYRVRHLIAAKKIVHLGVGVVHLAYDSTVGS